MRTVSIHHPDNREHPADRHLAVGAFVCDALDASEASSFERHLAVCPSCRSEASSFYEVLGSLVGVGDEPPPEMRSQVMAKIHVTRQLRPLVPPSAGAGRPARAERRSSWRRVR